jgi:hypothetical protein
VRYVYPIDDALPLYIDSKNATYGAVVDVAKQAKAKLSAQHQNKIDSVLFAVDASNSTTQVAFRAAYQVYAASPCTHVDYLAEAVRKTVDHQQQMQRAKIILDGLIQLASAKALSQATQDQISSGLTVVLHELAQPKQVLIQKLEEVPANTAEWGN